MRRLLARLVAISIIAAFLPVSAGATCEATIATNFARFTQVRMKLSQRCRGLVLAGRATGPCPDSKTTLQIEKARTKIRRAVNQRCGGADATCGIGGDDVDLMAIGWNVGHCPSLQDAGCTNAISHCGDVAECLVCVGEAAVDRMIELVYDAFTPPPPASPAAEVARCQATIGRSIARYFAATSSTLATCEQHNLTDSMPGLCPDPVKGAPRMAGAAEKLVNRLCGSCGSSDQVCGGDDLPVEWIGFLASCPDVTPPGGLSCVKPINNLVDLIECVRCVTDFHVDCLDPLAVPTLKSYPAECPAP